MTTAIDAEARELFIVDAHRDDGRRFVVRSDEVDRVPGIGERPSATESPLLEPGALRDNIGLDHGRCVPLASTSLFQIRANK